MVPADYKQTKPKKKDSLKHIFSFLPGAKSHCLSTTTLWRLLMTSWLKKQQKLKFKDRNETVLCPQWLCRRKKYPSYLIHSNVHAESTGVCRWRAQESWKRETHVRKTVIRGVWTLRFGLKLSETLDRFHISVPQCNSGPTGTNTSFWKMTSLVVLLLCTTTVHSKSIV